jgi:hypothetical protein
VSRFLGAAGSVPPDAEVISAAQALLDGLDRLLTIDDRASLSSAGSFRPPDRRRKRRQMRMCASWRKPGTETAKWSPRVAKSGANAMRCETAALSTADSSTGSARFRHQPLIH